jgi:hypothetical protein
MQLLCQGGDTQDRVAPLTNSFTRTTKPRNPPQ